VSNDDRIDDTDTVVRVINIMISPVWRYTRRARGETIHSRVLGVYWYVSDVISRARISFVAIKFREGGGEIYSLYP